MSLREYVARSAMAMREEMEADTVHSLAEIVSRVPFRYKVFRVRCVVSTSMDCLYGGSWQRLDQGESKRK